MNLTTAFEKFIERTGHSSLPWQTSRDEMLDIFTSGWLAHAESLKHADDLFPGTLSAPEAKLDLQSPCKGKVVDANSTGGSISAEDIYAAYPRKVGKQAAVKAIQKAIRQIADARGHDDMIGGIPAIEVLMERTQLYASHVTRWPTADKQFIPHPATWLNRGSYDDDPKEWVRGAAATPSQFTKKYE